MQNFRIFCQNAIKNARSSGYMLVSSNYTEPDNQYKH